MARSKLAPLDMTNTFFCGCLLQSSEWHFFGKNTFAVSVNFVTILASDIVINVSKHHFLEIVQSVAHPMKYQLSMRILQ